MPIIRFEKGIKCVNCHKRMDEEVSNRICTNCKYRVDCLGYQEYLCIMICNFCFVRHFMDREATFTFKRVKD